MAIAPTAGHALKEQLDPVLAASPLQAGPLYTALHDLTLAVEWRDVRVFELPGTGWTVILGHKRRDDPLRIVLPLPLHTTALKPSALHAIFLALESLALPALPAPLGPLAPSLPALRAQLDQRRQQRGPSEASGADPLAVTGGASTDGAGDGAVDQAINEEIDRSLIYVAIVAGDSTVVYYKLSKGIVKPRDVPDE